jgi:hypothetical protein
MPSSSTYREEYKFNFYKALQDELIDVNINEQLMTIEFILNKENIKKFKTNDGSKQNIESFKQLFFDSVLFLNNVEEFEDSVYVVDSKNLTVTGPLEVEILWIISMAIMTRKYVTTPRNQEKEYQNRLNKIRYYGKILFNYLKNDYFNDDTYVNIFIQFYEVSILSFIDSKIHNKIFEKYINIWNKYNLPISNSEIYNLPLDQNRSNIIQEYNNYINTIQLPVNVSLPDGLKLGGKKTKQNNTSKTNKHIKTKTKKQLKSNKMKKSKKSNKTNKKR